LIEDVADGKQRESVLTNGPGGQHSMADHLLRFLRPWLKPGTGGASKINYDPDRQLSCMGDKMKKRPPTIGLAHELCHARRNAVGQRLFDDALSCNLPDDEVMTTGFPPY
jgi:Effector protein